MDFLSHLVNFVNSIVNHFGISVIICVVMCQLVTIPFKIMSRKNNRLKVDCQPELEAIRKKYGATKMGLSLDEPEGLAPEIKRLSRDERDEAMANEISAVYKAHGYSMWTGWIPGFLSIIFIILLYSGIRAACPEGFYKLNFAAIQEAGNLAENIPALTVIGTMLGAALLTPVLGLIRGIWKAKKNNESVKAVIVSCLLSSALTVGLSVWIASSVTLAIAIAITTLYIWSFLESIITIIANSRHAETT